MGKVTRWLKGLLGMKRDKENLQSPSPNASSTDRKEKKRWSFGGKSARGTSNVVENDNIPANIPSSLSASDAAWLRSYIAESGSEQNKHAIAVAAATAAAADAAVAAAQAAVAVVRLTSQGSGMLNGKRERCAAVKIQTVFRGFLVCLFFCYNYSDSLISLLFILFYFFIFIFIFVCVYLFFDWSFFVLQKQQI